MTALTEEERRYYDWLIRSLVQAARRTTDPELLSRLLDQIEEKFLELAARVAETPLDLDREARRLEDMLIDGYARQADGHAERSRVSFMPRR